MATELEIRMRARRKVTEYFDRIRKALKVGPIWDFSKENQVKRRFLAELNAMARDFEAKVVEAVSGIEDEAKAMEIAENIISMARERVRRLKEVTIRELSSMPGADRIFSKVMQLIRNLPE